MSVDASKPGTYAVTAGGDTVISAAGMFSEAFSFCQAAQKLAAVHEDRTEAKYRAQTEYFSPIFFLSCHAIEIAFKALLRAEGFDDERLKSLGHDLRKGLEAVQSHYGPLPQSFVDLVNWLANDHLQHAFRYHTVRTFHLPNMGDMLAEIEPVMMNLWQHVRMRVSAHVLAPVGEGSPA